MPAAILEITEKDICKQSKEVIPKRRAFDQLDEETISRAAETLETATIWIVRMQMRDELKKLSNIIQDKEKKHGAVELSRFMKTKGSVIPMAEGFSSEGKLRCSLEKFFPKIGSGPQKLFILAVSDQLFSSLDQKASETLPAAISRNGALLGLMKPIPEPDSLLEAFVGNSLDAKEIRQLILHAAQVESIALIIGDTGTGKEIIAREIHRNSLRKDQPFKAVNCAALPSELFESEIFGHMKGAFNDAKDTNGLWLAAGQGTLFLDEIGELSASHQAKILRALQENKIRKIGGTTDIPVQARIICATNRNLFSMVQASQFREDLYYRLRGFQILTSPLREHPEDIPLLAQVFWKKITRDESAALPEDILIALPKYSWPGNVRELKAILDELFSYFWEIKPLDIRYLQAIFDKNKIEVQLETRTMSPGKVHRSNRFFRFRQLLRAYETLRAIEHVVTSLLNQPEGNSNNQEGISTRIGKLLNEVDGHCRVPRSFLPQTFDQVGLLRSRLAYFLSGYENEETTSLNDLQKSLQKIIQDAIAAILVDIDKAMAGIV